jgi:membrane protease YdiL (CAAX protease family)
MLFIFLVELVFGWIKITDLLKPGNTLPFVFGIGLALVNFLLVGIQEEVFSRGFLLRNLAESFKWRGISPKLALLIGYFISSSIFGLMHLGNPNTSIISTINLVVAGLFLGLGFVLTGELAIPIGLHITWNFLQGNVFGFPVSGTKAGATFIAIEQGGPDWMTGGAFGPEAGVIGLLAIALGCWLTVVWVKRTRGSVKLMDTLAVFKPALGKVGKPNQRAIKTMDEAN